MAAAGENRIPLGQHAAALTPFLVITPFVSTPSPGHFDMTDMEIAEMLAEAIDDFGERAIETTLNAASAGGGLASSVSVTRSSAWPGALQCN